MQRDTNGHASDERLEQYALGSLEEPLLGEIEEHLLLCSQCQEHLKAIDAYRARRARPHEVGEAALEVLPGPDDAERALESWAVADALSALRPEHRGVLLETYYRGKSVAEAAATLGIPAGTVKSRTFYALRALRLALEERGLAP